MALSQLRVNVLCTVAEDAAVPVSVLVGYQQEETGARRTVARAALSRSLRRLWGLGAGNCGRRASLTLGHSTAWLTAQTNLPPPVRRLVWWHLAHGSKPSADPIPPRVYVRAVAITGVGRDMLADVEDGRFPVRTRNRHFGWGP